MEWLACSGCRYGPQGCVLGFELTIISPRSSSELIGDGTRVSENKVAAGAVPVNPLLEHSFIHQSSLERKEHLNVRCVVVCDTD